MCGNLQICPAGALVQWGADILLPYDVKTAFAGNSGKYWVKFLWNGVRQNRGFASPLAQPPEPLLQRMAVPGERGGAQGQERTPRRAQHCRRGSSSCKGVAWWNRRRG